MEGDASCCSVVAKHAHPYQNNPEIFVFLGKIGHGILMFKSCGGKVCHVYKILISKSDFGPRYVLRWRSIDSRAATVFHLPILL